MNKAKNKRIKEKGKKSKIINEKQESTLENKVFLALSFGAFFCSFIFLSGGITGNMILNSSIKTSNLIGATLFIVGVVASFIYFEIKRK